MAVIAGEASAFDAPLSVLSGTRVCKIRSRIIPHSIHIMSDTHSTTDSWTGEVHNGDAMELLDELPESSVHALVTDPPYNFEGGFMSREWDDIGTPEEFERWCEAWGEKALRAVRPGGHVLAFGGSQSFHRLTCGLEDAGFEIRDVITWLYGCLSEDTEVLTPDGWKTSDEIHSGDEVVSFDPGTETLRSEPTRRVFRYEHEGEMIRYQSPETDQLVTPNHRVLHRNEGWETIYAMQSDGSMELPILHGSRKSEVPVSGRKGMRDLSDDIRESRPSSSVEETDLWRTIVRQSPSGMGKTSQFKTPRKTGRNGRGGSRGIRLGTTVARTSRVNYSGIVWCVNVPSSYFVARRNGKVFITGNSGFPKALDASKAIDDLIFQDWLGMHPEEKERLNSLDSNSDEYADLERELRERAGALREVSGVKPGHEEFADRSTDGHLGGEDTNDEYKRPWMEREEAASYHMETDPGSEEAERWDGWKTSLKPAVEFVTVARAPLEGRTVAENILRYGTGALNIRPSRIEIRDGGGDGNWSSASTEHRGDVFDKGTSGLTGGVESEMDEDGRYPPNLILDQSAARQVDRGTGSTTKGDGDTYSGQDRSLGPNGIYGNGDPEDGTVHSFDDEGGPARYFKTVDDADQNRFKYTSKASKSERTLDGRIENAHPSVKPVELCEWLVRLVAAPRQTVLDPFCGSGSTLLASRNLGRKFIGFEMQDKWAEVSRARVGLNPENPAALSPDNQTGLGEFAVEETGANDD